MAYIYQITNDINGKIYIGKTEYSIEERFKEHCKAATRQKEKHRPLYSAMRKYGIEHFHIELIEETNNPEEREVYWVELKGSFKTGYNATLGGDGRKYIDYDQVEAVYRQLQNCVATANCLNISVDSVRKILHARGVDIKSGSQIAKEQNAKVIAMYDPSDLNNILQVFSSYAEAARYLIMEKKTRSQDTTGIGVHIRDVCKGRRKTAYGYIWRLI